MDVKIIPATNDTLNDIILIENSLEHHILSANSIKASLNNNSNYCYIAKLNNKIIGYIAFEYMIDHIDLLSIAVLKEYRQKNVGSLLLNTMFDISYKLNVQNIFLEVRKSNTSATNFYEKHGFKKINTRKNYYTNDNEDAYIYLKNLA